MTLETSRIDPGEDPPPGGARSRWRRNGSRTRRPAGSETMDTHVGLRRPCDMEPRPPRALASLRLLVLNRRPRRARHGASPDTRPREWRVVHRLSRPGRATPAASTWSCQVATSSSWSTRKPDKVFDVVEGFVQSIRTEQAEIDQYPRDRPLRQHDSTARTKHRRWRVEVTPGSPRWFGALIGRYRREVTIFRRATDSSTFDRTCAGYPLRHVDRGRGPRPRAGDRAGLHTGECELIDGKVGGIAVHIGARVGAMAGPSEVLVSQR